MKLRISLAVVLLSASLGFAQNIKFQDIALSAGGFPFPTVRVCVEPASGTPCTPLAPNIYADPGGSQPLSNPFTGDAGGNFLFYASPASTYHVQISGVGITTYDIPNITLPGGGGGGGAFYQTIQANGSSKTQRPVLNLIQGSGMTVSCVDNAGQTRTDCTLTSTGGGSSITLQTNGTGNSSQALLNLVASSGIGIVNTSGGIDTFTNLGVLSITTDSQATVTGAFTSAAGDYGTKGIAQNGTGTLSITKTAGGTVALGSACNFLKILADSAVTPQISWQDCAGDYILTGTGVVQMGTNPGAPGANVWLNTSTVRFMFGTNAAIEDYDFTDTSAVYQRPLDLEYSNGSNLLINADPGLSTQCLLGGGVGWGSCAAATVGSVAGTSGQIVNTGTSSAVVLALASPLNPPGNVGITQLTNGSTALTLTRNTDVAPTGNLLQCLTAGLAVLCSVDVLGNGSFNSVAAVGTGAGMVSLTAGPDNSSLCPANSKCFEAGASIPTSWTDVSESAGPSVYSVEGFAALSGAKTQRAYIPTTDSSAPTFIQTAVASAAGASSGVVAVFDGGGNTQSSGLNISSIGGSGCNSASVTVPVVCGSVNSLSRVTSLGNTNILTGTAAAGLYQLSVYLNGTANACTVVGGGQFAAKIAYSDSNGAVTFTAGTLAFSTSLPNEQPIVITFWNQSSTSTINVSGTYTACGTPSGGGAYTLDAHYTLLRIQ